MREFSQMQFRWISQAGERRAGELQPGAAAGGAGHDRVVHLGDGHEPPLGGADEAQEHELVRARQGRGQEAAVRVRPALERRLEPRDAASPSTPPSLVS